MCKINCSGGCKECDPESHLEAKDQEIKEFRSLLEQARDALSDIRAQNATVEQCRVQDAINEKLGEK